jgi:hypothetical protein
MSIQKMIRGKEYQLVHWDSNKSRISRIMKLDQKKYPDCKYILHEASYAACGGFDSPENRKHGYGVFVLLK